MAEGQGGNFMSRQKLFLQEFFYFLSALGLVMVLLEIIWPAAVIAYFNLNILWLAWLATGLVLLFKE